MNDRILAVEVKASRGEKVRFNSNQVKKLFDFLDIFSVYSEKIALLAGKFPYKWVFKQVKETDDYVVYRNEKGIKLSDLLER